MAGHFSSSTPRSTARAGSWSTSRVANRLAGKVALISGGARGMGESHARRFAAEGARVMISDVLDEEGQTVAKDIGDAAAYVHLDVTDEQSWTDAVTATTEAFGKVDV